MNASEWDSAVWDSVVIGGGPAGCSAAITLAQRGLRVALLESGSYPRNKLCGEFLSPECTGLLAGLGLGRRLAALNPVPIRTVTLTAPDGAAWEGSLPGPALGLTRSALDQALAEQAQAQGAVVREHSTVTGLVGSLKEGFELEVRCGSQTTTVLTRSVIAAHGKRAALDRVLGRRFLTKHQPYMAIKAHFHGPPIPGRIELHAFPGGYCGLSEVEGGRRVVCFIVREDVFRAHRGQVGDGLEVFVRWMKDQNLYLRSWLQWAERISERWTSIAQVPLVGKQVIERDVLMAGDSAGMIAPLAGDGIAMALATGQMAAGYLERFLNGALSPELLRRAYPAAWGRQFNTRLLLGRMLHPLMTAPWAAGAALRGFNRLPAVGRLLVRRLRGPFAGKGPGMGDTQAGNLVPVTGEEDPDRGE